MKQNQIFILSILFIVISSGCISQTESQNVSQLNELKTDAQKVNATISSYFAIDNNLEAGIKAKSSALASSYIRSAVDKTRALSDTNLEYFVDAVVAKKEQNEDYQQEITNTFDYMVTNIGERCVSLADKTTLVLQLPETVTIANNEFLMEHQKLVGIWQDTLSMRNATSKTMKKSYALSALNKSKEVGEKSELVPVFDGIMKRLENNEDLFITPTGEYDDRQFMQELKFVLLGLEMRKCTNLIDAISNS